MKELKAMSDLKLGIVSSRNKIEHEINKLHFEFDQKLDNK